MIEPIGIILPIFLTMLTGIVTITLFFIPSQAELNEASIENRESYSKITKDDDDNNNNNNANHPLIINQKEKNALNENISSYDGLGIKLENFTPWTILTKSDKSTCYNINLCFINLGIINGTTMPQVWIIQDSFESQTIKEYCKCNTLEDYESHFHKNMISQFDKFSFINENQTTFSDDRSIIQLEYEFSPQNNQIHTYTIFTENDDSFYQFSYYAEPETFSNNLPDFKKIIDIIEFTAHNKS